MFEDFTTISYLLSFPGMIAAVILLTQFTKRMWDKAGTNQTKFIVLGYAMVFCILAAIVNGDFSDPMMIVQTIIVWGFNAVIVWFAAMKTFEVATNKNSGVMVVSDDNIELNLTDDMEALSKRKELRILVNTKPKIPSQE